jgi:hypothetical protein
VEERKSKLFTTRDNINILARVDACIGAYVDRTSQLQLSSVHINTVQKRFFFKALEITETLAATGTGICCY